MSGIAGEGLMCLKYQVTTVVVIKTKKKNKAKSHSTRPCYNQEQWYRWELQLHHHEIHDNIKTSKTDEACMHEVCKEKILWRKLQISAGVLLKGM